MGTDALSILTEVLEAVRGKVIVKSLSAEQADTGKEIYSKSFNNDLISFTVWDYKDDLPYFNNINKIIFKIAAQGIFSLGEFKIIITSEEVFFVDSHLIDPTLHMDLVRYLEHNNIRSKEVKNGQFAIKA